MPITANASQGYLFKNWSGALCGNENPISLSFNSDKKVIAVFEKLDSDSDGVSDDLDKCPETPSGEIVNKTGCSDSQTDTDGDGVNDATDECNDTLEGESVGVNGCLPDPMDLDEDGVANDIDQCPETPSGEPVDSLGCSSTQTDIDEDGVANELDQCNDTPKGESVDENGCSTAQIDSDNDGVADDKDQCTATTQGESVDEKGCATSQIDSDNDGVKDDKDECGETPSGESVNELGCSESQKDSDEDGITNNEDNCPDTPKDENVNENGCSTSQIDTDEDGIVDNRDQCPETPSGEEVDAEGCSNSQKDSDEDGVNDAIDQCADTPKDDTVDAEGCTDIELTYVPDDAFEQYLIDQGHDDVLDDHVVTAKINTVEKVSINKNGIASYDVADLTGLEDFEAITDLFIGYSSISSLDISKYDGLKRLEVTRNGSLTTLYIDDTRLEYLSVHQQYLASLILHDNKDLKEFFMEDLRIIKFVISNNPILYETGWLFPFDVSVDEMEIVNNKGLKNIGADTCPVKKLTITGNEKLTIADFDPFSSGGIALNSLVISNNPNLKDFHFREYSNIIDMDIRNSEFPTVDLSTNPNLISLNVTENPLTCIKVSQNQLDNIPTGWFKDPEDTYSLTCE